MKDLINFIFCCAWLAGIIIAKGFWSTFFAMFFPPWSWYLLVERILQVNGLL